MELFLQILTPVLWLSGIGLVLGILLAFASRCFAVEADGRLEELIACLPGANCGGCGYSGCAAAARAIAVGRAGTGVCTVGGAPTAALTARIMGVPAEPITRFRAQVMCSGSSGAARAKYIYQGAEDCNAAVRLGGGDKLCPNGCIGLGTCVASCKFDAIRILDGVAVVDYTKCRGCGVCTFACPKHLIKLIPYDSRHWVGCRSVDRAAVTKQSCDVGCISCRLCERVCEAGAIRVTDFVASIDYAKCTGCDRCVAVCPRNIIWSARRQGQDGLVFTRAEVRNNP